MDEIYSVIGEKWDVYQNRYVAFLAERLHSLYFMFHIKTLNYKIVPYKILSSADAAWNIDSALTEEQIFQNVEEMLSNRQVKKPVYMFLIGLIRTDAVQKSCVLFIRLCISFVRRIVIRRKSCVVIRQT